METKYQNINGEWVVSTGIYKKRILTIELIHSVLNLLEEKYGFTEIRESDFVRIVNNADFLVKSYQVVRTEDIDLDAAYECLNDTQVAGELPETEPEEKQSNHKEPKKR